MFIQYNVDGIFIYKLQLNKTFYLSYYDIFPKQTQIQKFKIIKFGKMFFYKLVIESHKYLSRPTNAAAAFFFPFLPFPPLAFFTLKTSTLFSNASLDSKTEHCL